MEYYQAFTSLSIYPHHLKQNICGSRAKYRDGKKETAVKVYTVNQESMYIIITNVPAIGGSEELRALCDQYGIVGEFQFLSDYPCEEFTEAYLVKYNSFPAARFAKRNLDDKSFLGSTLHVFYAPEFESVNETRIKLQERRMFVAGKTKKSQNMSSVQKRHAPASNSIKSVKTVSDQSPTQPVTYVWAGKEYTMYPNASTSTEPILEDKLISKNSSNIFLPRQLKQTSSDIPNYSSTFSEKQNNFSNVDESSYMKTISNVRTKISNVSVPNVRVSLKRRKRI